MDKKFNHKINRLLDIDVDIIDPDVEDKVEAELDALQSGRKIKKSRKIKTCKYEQDLDLATMRIFEPKTYQDTQNIAEALCVGQVVYVSLVKLTNIEANRVVDFLTGVVYGLAGDIERLDKEIFICTPTNIEITDEMRKKM